MGVWSHITGVIHFDGNVTEDELLSVYGMYSHDVKGSEGGLHISFTRTTKRKGSRSSESTYSVEPFTRLSNMVFNGSLRDFEEEKLEDAVTAIKEYIERVHEFCTIKNASFVFECDHADSYYHLTFVRSNVRIKKMKLN